MAMIAVKPARAGDLPKNAELEAGAEKTIALERDPDLRKKPHSEPFAYNQPIMRTMARRLKEAETDIRHAEMKLLGEGKTLDALTAMAIRRTPLEEVMDLVRLAYASNAVKVCKGNQSDAAKMLGIHRNTLSRILGAEY